MRCGVASASLFTPRRVPCVVGGDHAYQLCRPQCLPVEHLQQWRTQEGGGLQRHAVTSDHSLRRLRHHPTASRPFLCARIKKSSLALQLADDFESSALSSGGSNPEDRCEPLPFLPQLVSFGAHRRCGSSQYDAAEILPLLQPPAAAGQHHTGGHAVVPHTPAQQPAGATGHHKQMAEQVRLHPTKKRLLHSKSNSFLSVPPQAVSPHTSLPLWTFFGHIFLQ